MRLKLRGVLPKRISFGMICHLDMKGEYTLIKGFIRCTSLLVALLALGTSMALAQTHNDRASGASIRHPNGGFKLTDLLAQAQPQKRRLFTLMPDSHAANAGEAAVGMTPMGGGSAQTVMGGGTLGRLTKWTGFTSSNPLIGDSTIFESKSGLVGIGTDSPTSKLTIAGMIETTLGGYKFPDGTVQTTSAAGALFGVAHDATLQGNGTAASPLGVAVPLNLSGSLSLAVFSATNNGFGIGVSGFSSSNIGVSGISTSGDGVRGESTNSEGVRGISRNGTGVRGDGPTGVQGTGNFNPFIGGTGVQGFGGDSPFRGGTGVQGSGGNGVNFNGGDGLVGFGGVSGTLTHAGGRGVFAMRGLGIDGAVDGLAGFFLGDVTVAGKLTKTMGTFKIDHPLDPENKYLYHSFVESPDMMNIYNGNITTDQNGEAVVEMPDYFDALNKDFRYQLTVIGTFAQAIVANKMKSNRFVIKTNAPNVEVSWMVTGVRQDAYAEKNRVKVEEDKSERERGYYLHPEVFNQPEEKSIEWARNPEMMQRLKQERLEAEAKMKKAQNNDR